MFLGGIDLIRASVGDKYVLEELLSGGGSLGGEQSGHIIFPEISLAGDGLIIVARERRCSAVLEHDRDAELRRHDDVVAREVDLLQRRVRSRERVVVGEQLGAGIVRRCGVVEHLALPLETLQEPINWVHAAKDAQVSLNTVTSAVGSM